MSRRRFQVGVPLVMPDGRKCVVTLIDRSPPMPTFQVSYNPLVRLYWWTRRLFWAKTWVSLFTRA